MLLAHYRLCITYTLAGFLFDLDEYICREFQKIESLIRQDVSILKKICRNDKEVQISEVVKQYFPGFLAFIDYTEQQIPKPTDNKRRCSIRVRRKDIYCKNGLWLTTPVSSFIN